MVVWIILGAIALLIFLALLTAFICYRIVFYCPKRNPLKEDEESIPDGEIYEPYREDFVYWRKTVKTFPHKDVEVKSFDGLTLRGKYFEFAPGAPIELMMHGYRGDGERDLSGGVLRCFNLNRSVLLIDHRACGKSDGKTTTFGIKESKDCLSWINFIINNIDKNAKIILTGVSMGATTAMIASSMDLPKNVVGILADCGFTSAKDIIIKVVKDLKLPPKLFYPFIKLGAKLFGRFDLEQISPITALKNCKLPILFLHGKSDDFVPCYMSQQNYDACTSPDKRLVLFDGAGHGLCYMTDQKKYMDELNDFFSYILNK